MSSSATIRPDASSCTTSIWPRPIVLPLAMVSGGAADPERMNANEATPPARNARRGSHRLPVLVFVVIPVLPRPLSGRCCGILTLVEASQKSEPVL